MPEDPNLTADQKIELHYVLSNCSNKLEVYRKNTDGNYQGGMEHATLIKLIEETVFKFCTQEL